MERVEKARGVRAGMAAPVKAAAQVLGVHKRTLQFWLEGRVHSRNASPSRLLKELRRLGEED